MSMAVMRFGSSHPQSMTPSTPTCCAWFSSSSTLYTGTSGCPFSCASWLMARENGTTDATCVWLSMTCASSGSGCGAGAQLRLRWCLLMFSRLVPIGPALRANSRSRVKRGSARFAAYTSLNRDGGERPCRCRVVAVCQINRRSAAASVGDSSPTCPAYGLSPARRWPWRMPPMLWKYSTRQESDVGRRLLGASMALTTRT